MRHKKTKKRQINPDPMFNNLLVAKLVNKIMRAGKKSVAQHQVYAALEVLREKSDDPVALFDKAVFNISPRMEVRPRRVGGASYQIPMEVRTDRKITLALRWLIETARKRSSKEYHSFAQKLAAEILDASQNTGEAIKKRDMMHRMAEANKAFAHFRW
ncbi:30S ribosomal protein S7 [Candidatus Microgenomates bacterium]|nr:30S ribosomal protein S7 [Candidatus Microgenomates bacterium]